MKVVCGTNSVLATLRGKILDQPHNNNATATLYHTKNLVFKEYNLRPEKACENIYSLTKIMQRKSELAQLHELVLPEEIVEIDGEVIGYTMEYVEGQVLSEALKMCTSKMAFSWFADIANVIERTSSLPFRFHIGDLHEENVMVDSKGNLRFIDIDGFAIDECKQNSCRHLALAGKDWLPSKYICFDDGTSYATKDSDLFCLVQMVLNYLMAEKSLMYTNLFFDEPAKYLSFLSQQGIPQIFIDMVNRVYAEETNYFDGLCFSAFPTELKDVSYASFADSMCSFDSNEAALIFLNDLSKTLLHQSVNERECQEEMSMNKLRI